MDISCGSSVIGKVGITVSKSDGTVKRRLSFDNLVLDSGYKELFRRQGITFTDFNDSPQALITYLYLGSGTTEPQASDTGLQSRSPTLPGKSGGSTALSVDSVTDVQNHYYESSVLMRFRYGEGEAEGVWTELGLSDLNYINPFTRALFRDSNGNPTSLTILSDEFLTVDYTITVVPGAPRVASITVGGVQTGGRFFPSYLYSTSSGSKDARAFFSATNGGTIRTLKAIKAIRQNLDFHHRLDWYERADGVFPGTQAASLSQTGDFLYEGTLTLGPTDNNASIEGITVAGAAGEYDASKQFGTILFDQPIIKLADYTVTFTFTMDLSILSGPVTGVSFTATASNLDFSWNAYADATEYDLVLRQAGSVTAEMTVTAPAVSASFSGLTAGTEYSLQIRPRTSGRDGVRSIHTATTETA